ncbi:MAG: hypothetical protein HYY50_02930 [Candidatus Kerfeldbacteria bacterium]|nr:hypothetical protein [Candidatus Kerfeldbacteria bacterium]
MGAEIIPAVLASRANAFRRQLAVAEQLHRLVHIDLMDGRFVHSRSLSEPQLRRLTPPRSVEWHFMTYHPEAWLGVIASWPTKRVILHLELGTRLPPLVALFRSRRIAVSLALKMTTSLVRLQPWIRQIESVVVMAIEPGRQHNPFQPHVLPRLRQLRRRYPQTTVACDGGLNPLTIPRVVAAGARRLIIGSHLLAAADPHQAYRDAQRAASGVRR